MPSSPTIVPTSIVTFYTAPHGDLRTQHDEVFLLYSKGFEKGRARGIHRDGIGSPWMWDEDARRHITDPEEQRRGTWLIDRGFALELERAAIQNVAWQSPDVLNEWLNELESIPDYVSEFQRVYGQRGYKLLGMRGSGNLTMNGWFVGFVNSDFTDGRPVFLYRREEPCEERPYTCFVKTKSDHRVSIELLRFNLYKGRVLSVNDGRESDITNDIEFAVFGQQLVKAGELVDFRRVVTQFEDIRSFVQVAQHQPASAIRRYPAIAAAENVVRRRAE